MSAPTPAVSVIVCTHNPVPSVLERALAALQGQTLPASGWELLLVDNASTLPLPPVVTGRVPQARFLTEPRLGLTHARRAGVRAARAAILVFVDDDNVLAPDYLTQAVEIMQRLPSVAAVGGKSIPEFDRPAADWLDEFAGLLALRNLGDQELIASAGSPLRYPDCSPIGAGMVVRREALESWLKGGENILDRTGSSLASGGDNDIVLHVLRSGWHVGYCPRLVLHHLIPERRMDPGYLGRLNRAMQKSWMQVLSSHGANPWPEIAGWTLPLRVAKAWIRHAPWRSKPASIRFQGAVGHFEGRCRGPGRPAKRPHRP